MADYGFVYCLGNDCMPGVYKVGKTSRTPLNRAAELSSSTSVPTEFDVLFYIETDEMSDLEKDMHRELEDFRVSHNREFFEVDIDLIYGAFERAVEDPDLPLAITRKGKGALAEIDFENERIRAFLKDKREAEMEADDGQDQNSQA